MDLQQRWLPNDSQVAGKVLDGEAIIINLSNGNYYSMREVGGVVWEEIMRGASVAEIVATVVRRYEVDSDQAARDLKKLWVDLERENLVRTSDQPSRIRAEAPMTGKAKYEPPSLNIYRDMNDLLALDPPMPGLQDIPWKEVDE